MEIGEDAGVCECVPDAVSLDMRIFGDLCTRCHSDTEEDESSGGRLGRVRERGGFEQKLAARETRHRHHTER